MPDFGSLFESLGKALTSPVIPEEGGEVAAKSAPEGPAGAGATVPVLPKLPQDIFEPSPATGITPPAVKQPKIPMPPKQPFDPSSRVQQLDPIHAEDAARIELSPAYLDRLRTLGGGRTVTHDETWARALNRQPMTIEELGGWQAGRKVNEVDVARAGLLRTRLWEQYMEAIHSGNELAAMDAERAITHIEPGYNNLTATPGRATEFQKVFQAGDAVQEKVRQLRAANVPFDQVKDEINALMSSLAKQHDLEKMDEGTKSLLRRIENYATAAKLSSPVTSEVKAVSDGLTYLTRGLEQTLKSGILGTMGRPEEADAARMYAWGTSQGFKDGARKFLDTYLEPAPKGTLLAGDVTKTEGKNYPIPLRALNPFRLLGGIANFWHAVVNDAEINTRVYTQAAKEGLSGDALVQRMQDIKTNLPEDWKNEAFQTANEYTYQEDPDRLLRAIQKLQNVPGMRLIIPVAKVPYNITRFTVRRGPAGMLYAALNPGSKFGKMLYAGGNQRAEALARIGVGMGMIGLASSLVATGQVTGAMPEDKAERALWEAENRQPWAIRIGDKWVKFNRLQPIGGFMTQVAAAHEALKKGDFDTGKSIQEKLLYQYGHGALDIPFFEGMQALVQALEDPGRRIASLGRLTATGFIPNLLRDIRYQTDPALRKPENLKEAIQNMVPGLSTQVPPKINILGKPMEVEPERVLRATKHAFPVEEDENTQFLREIGYSPLDPNTTLRVKGQKAELTGTNRESYLKEMGEATLGAIQLAMKDPRVQGLDAPMKRRVVARVVEAARMPITRKYEVLMGLYGPEAKERYQSKENQQ